MSGAVDIFLVQGILSSRVYAIYKRPRMLKYCLVALFTCCSTISIALIALSMRDVPGEHQIDRVDIDLTHFSNITPSCRINCLLHIKKSSQYMGILVYVYLY